ncbi:hypothetical protein SCA6_000534 [Theobroma cacao]
MKQISTRIPEKKKKRDIFVKTDLVHGDQHVQKEDTSPARYKEFQIDGKASYHTASGVTKFVDLVRRNRLDGLKCPQKENNPNGLKVLAQPPKEIEFSPRAFVTMNFYNAVS